MTNTYDTSNEPLGSTAVKVLYNNASNLDDAVNSDDDTWVDRPPFGRVRRTWRGMENAFDEFLAGTAFELPPLVYVDGTPLQVDRATQLIQRSGLLYSVKLPSTFPVNLSGTWTTDEPMLTVRNDQSLRQGLSGSAKVGEGSSLVGDSSIILGSLLDFTQIVTPIANRAYSCVGYRPGSVKGGGQFVWQAGASKALHDGVAIIDPSRTFPTDFDNVTQVTNWLTPAASGTGVFVKVWSEVRSGYESGLADTASQGDRLMLSAMLESLKAQGGRLGILPYGVARVLPYTVEVPRAVALDMNDSSVEFQITGAIRAFSLNTKSQLYNGTVTVVGTSPSGGGDNHAAVSGGNQSTGQGLSKVKVHDLTLSTNRPDGNGVCFFGETTNSEFKDLTFPSSNTLGRAVALEWGGSTSGTGHPHNCTVTNINCGTMSANVNNGFMVWLSSSFNITVTNVYADSVYGLVGIFTGDRSNDYAPLRYRDLVGTGIVVENPTCRGIRQYGIRCYGKGGLSDNLLPQSATIINPVLRSDGLTASAVGVVCEYTENVTVINPDISYMQIGISTGTQVRNLLVKGGKVWGNRASGISIGNAGGGVARCTIEGVRLYGNNSAGFSGVGGAAAIFIQNCTAWAVNDCHFGIGGGGETQQYSVRIETTAPGGVLKGNRTLGLVAGGVAYVNSSSTDYAIGTMGGDNAVDAGLSGFGGAPIYQIDWLGNKSFQIAGAVPPASGSWTRGDKCYYGSPSPSGNVGAVCTSTGTPGTWKGFGAIAA